MKTRDFASPDRMAQLCNNALDVIATLVNRGELGHNEELYSWLREEVGMTDGEIRQAGFECPPDEEMTVPDVIEHLRDLAKDRESFFNEDGDDEIFRADHKALLKAIELLEKTERIEVNTVFGKLSAEVCSDPNYPGIVICIEQDGEGGKYDRQLAVAECTPDVPIESSHALRLMVWNSDDEDFTDDFTFLKDDNEP